MADRSKVTVKWLGNGSFQAIDEKGNYVFMQAHSLKKGNEDPDHPAFHSLTPSELLLAAMAGCSSVDVVSILGKMRKKLEGLEVEVVGKRVEGYPTRYSEINLTYRAISPDANQEELEKSVELSMEKYCSVSITVKRGANVSTSCEIVKPQL
jgi:putative redox protein